MTTCTKCKGRGWYSFDHNSYYSKSKPCEVCCKHDQGFWLLTEHYGNNNGKWCCKAGCAFTTDTPQEEINLLEGVEL